VLGTLHAIPTGTLRFSIEATWVFQCPTHFKKWGPMAESWQHTTIKFGAMEMQH